MDKKDYIEEFEKIEYAEATRAFIKGTTDHISENIQVISKEITVELDDFFKNIALVQKKQPIPIGQITISLIRVTAWEDKKRIRLDAYDDELLIGRNVAFQYMDGGWLFTAWDKYYEDLKNRAKASGKERYIKDAAIKQMMNKSLKELASILAYTLKYILDDADYLEHYNDLIKTEGFVISAGEYMDRQKILFAQLPEVDIFFNPDKKPLVFQKIEYKRYHDKEFTDFDLRNARFTHCDFIRCKFENVDLSDVRFVDCTFKTVEMKSGKLYGASFTDCIMENVNTEGMSMKWIPFENGESEETELYRDVQYRNCLIDNELISPAT